MDAKDIKFKSVSKEEWEAKIIKDLKGKDLSTISSKIGTNITTKPNHHADDNAFAINSFRQNKDWNMGYRASSNQEALYGLQQGMNSIRIESSNNLDQLLKDVQLDIVNAYIPIKSSADILSYSNYIANKQNHCTHPFVTFSQENLNLTIENTLAFSKLKETRTVQIDSDPQLDGASSSNAIASLLLKCSSLISESLANQNLNLSSKDIVFNWKVGINFLEEIAALRALRVCIANVFKGYDSDYSKIYIAAEPNEYYFANKDTANNILRESTMLSSAILGGADEIISVKYNTNDNPKETNRIAQNIQLILKEEAYMNEVKDPSKGSYYIEHLTKEIADKSWLIFQGLSDKTNLTEALDVLTKEVQKEEAAQIEQYKTGEKTILGENKFQNPLNETPSDFNSIANKIS